MDDTYHFPRMSLAAIFTARGVYVVRVCERGAAAARIDVGRRAGRDQCVAGSAAGRGRNAPV